MTRALDDLGVNDEAGGDVEHDVEDARRRRGMPSATEIRLLAESSSVLSNHWVAVVKAGLRLSINDVACERAVIRSLRIGLRL